MLISWFSPNLDKIIILFLRSQSGFLLPMQYYQPRSLLRMQHVIFLY